MIWWAAYYWAIDIFSTRNPKLPLSTSLTDPESRRGEGSEKFLGVINGAFLVIHELHLIQAPQGVALIVGLQVTRPTHEMKVLTRFCLNRLGLASCKVLLFRKSARTECFKLITRDCHSKYSQCWGKSKCVVAIWSVGLDRREQLRGVGICYTVEWGCSGVPFVCIWTSHFVLIRMDRNYSSQTWCDVSSFLVFFSLILHCQVRMQ